MSVEHSPASGSSGATFEANAPATRWYLVQTEAGCEILADRYLTQGGYLTYLPSTLRTVRHARQQHIIETPFFPDYIFVALDLETQAWKPIERTPGVLRLVVVDSRPAQAPAGYVEALMEVGALDGISETPQLSETDSESSDSTIDITERLGVMRGLSGDERVRALLAMVRAKAEADIWRDPAGLPAGSHD